jgi:hypothetical protein
MKSTSIKFLAVVGLVALFAVALITLAPKTQAQSDKESANGQGTLLDVDENGNTIRRQFSFSARRNSDGTVKGNAVLHNPAFTGENGKQKYQLQIDISCMKVIGNTAFFGGTTRRTNDPNLVDAVYFSVQDNGEPGRGKDAISRVFFFDEDPTTVGDPGLCQNNTVGDFPMEVIDSGNIQVRGGGITIP